jgi:SpoVK/Ycf46/Vps4 family AAA+-type ATPase
MRKGADLLSKWVGEAERQLRLLFSEAARCQPAIIFFDEIDGLAPVSGWREGAVGVGVRV